MKTEFRLERRKSYTIRLARSRIDWRIEGALYYIVTAIVAGSAYWCRLIGPETLGRLA